MSKEQLNYNRYGTPRDRYLNDDMFKRLVDMMVAHLHQAMFTPSEMREAAIMASIIYAEQAPHISPFETPKANKAMSFLQELFDKPPLYHPQGKEGE